MTPEEEREWAHRWLREWLRPWLRQKAAESACQGRSAQDCRRGAVSVYLEVRADLLGHPVKPTYLAMLLPA